MTDERRPVIVGFDGSEHGRLAVVWAADEAARQERRLIVVCVEDYAGVGLRGPVSMSHLWLQSARAEATRTATAGVLLARQVAPEVRVEPIGAVGAPARVLADTSSAAALLVVGTHARGALAQVALGSVAETVAARGSCPVVVVRSGSTAHPGPYHPVVVGVDGSAAAARAVDVAADIAADAGAQLTVVGAWTPAVWSYGSSVAAAEGAQTWPLWSARDAVAVAVDRARANHPGLQVRGTEIEGPPAVVLAEQAARAGLLVVGSRGRGAVRSLLLGSASHAVARSAPCAVAVVGPHCAGPVEDAPRSHPVGAGRH